MENLIKKAVYFGFIAVLAFVFIACGESESSGDDDENNSEEDGKDKNDTAQPDDDDDKKDDGEEGGDSEDPNGGNEEGDDDDNDSTEGDDDDNDDNDDEEPIEPTFPLKEGDSVPDFEIPLQDGSIFKLSDYKGKKRLLISSFPAAYTSVCTSQINNLNNMYDQFIELNTVPFGFSVDTVETLARWKSDKAYTNLDFMSDAAPKGEVSKMFGIFSEQYQAAERGNIVIDENGVIIFYKKGAMGLVPDFEEILDFLKTL